MMDEATRVEVVAVGDDLAAMVKQLAETNPNVGVVNLLARWGVLRRTLEQHAQPSLFDTPAEQRARARRADPGTSRQAAASIEDLRANQRAVLDTLRRNGPRTDEELVEAYGYANELAYVEPQSPSGIRTRRRELADAGLVVDTGQRRQLRSGRQAIVWATKETN